MLGINVIYQCSVAASAGSASAAGAVCKFIDIFRKLH
jgi:hypothetical protein